MDKKIIIFDESWKFLDEAEKKRKRLICPFCQENFSPWKKRGLDITCKECTDFHIKKYGKEGL